MGGELAHFDHAAIVGPAHCDQIAINISEFVGLFAVGTPQGFGFRDLRHIIEQAVPDIGKASRSNH